jgi:hypothetical protein
MSKPDGIPQDIWDLAGDCVKRLRLPELLDIEFDTPEEMDRLTMEIVGEDGLTIAHAIMAEREACAAILDERAKQHIQSTKDAWQKDNAEGGILYALLEQEAFTAAAAIRNRGAAA